ncbi:hypothetical protein FA09DRAFT_11071 [Tilletiopsis washingtonensis]|uniref:Uncharacterized protein n=1 Tax=Tilletiopsis washingtonensis TaxID=58919 RepID=A0A316ZK10_9BASI|nr:hypothetical protein FA09DRAFT_11071 [Tilletiopsis washingtonensis]PWO01343.1 hypothetical protein FA09DRAFT_11071 [Tilletiopsis washingtonensis]
MMSGCGIRTCLPRCLPLAALTCRQHPAQVRQQARHLPRAHRLERAQPPSPAGQRYVTVLPPAADLRLPSAGRRHVHDAQHLLPELAADQRHGVGHSQATGALRQQGMGPGEHAAPLSFPHALAVHRRRHDRRGRVQELHLRLDAVCNRHVCFSSASLTLLPPLLAPPSSSPSPFMSPPPHLPRPIRSFATTSCAHACDGSRHCRCRS